MNKSKSKKEVTRGKGSGVRRHFKGKMVLPSGKPRSQHNQPTTKAAAGYTVDDTHDKNFGTTGLASARPALGPYRVAMPEGRVHYIRSPR